MIVPVFKASRWIEKCVHGLLNQEYNPSRFEIILVDDNSSDDSKSLIQRHPRVRLLEENVQSSYAVRNRGVRESSGDLLAFTDADCVPAPNWLEAIASAMINSRTQAMLGTRTPGAAEGPVKLIAAYEDARVSYILENRRQRSYFAFTSNMAIRRRAFERYGPFETVMRGTDTLFLLRSAWTYLKKSFIHAQTRKRTKHLGQCEGLTAAECLHIFRNVSRGWPPGERAALAFLLSTGRLTWLAGSLL